MPTVASYGSWESPISTTMLADEAIVAHAPVVDGDDLYWAERRPAEGGRTAVVRRGPGGAVEDVLPAGFNARTRIHEYGGVSYVVAGGVLLATDFADQRVYRLDGETPAAITPEPSIEAGDRYADVTFHGSNVIAVRERHDDGEPTNELVVFPLDGSTAPRVIATGHDFYSSLRRSPDGRSLAWLTWDHPRMPWDGSDLWVAALAGDGTLGALRHVAGGEQESIFQPEWSPSGALYWASDRTGWWNLYREGDPIAPMDAEIGTPQWVFGLARYGFLDDGRIVAVVTEAGRDRPVVIDDGAVRDVAFPHDTIVNYLAIAGSTVWTVAGDATTPLGIVGVDIESGEVQVARRNFDVEIEPGYFSDPIAIEAPTTGGAVTHGFFYPPKNPRFEGPEGELPPLIVMSHGGPTSATHASLDLEIQFWTSRGIGVVDVNYRGSTGYGRTYRQALEGQWGIVDTDDCIAAARYLADAGHVDPSRMAIVGGSAGGYTTLCALAFHDIFSAGVSYFGVADCAALAEDTHKFESRYLDSLIGSYPEQADLYRQRSPLYHPEGFSCPVLLLQGADDKVVPPAQAEVMVAALAERGIPHAYVLFEGEGHGFRKAENVIAARNAELSFYGQVFGFAPAGDVPFLELSTS
jgi:dipeptidyl aminopeptidase/acylaminoacyl peptidase